MLNEQNRNLLTARPNGSEGAVDIDTADGFTVAGNVGKNIARRIVACWNACDGSETEVLERLGADYIAPIIHLIDERDNLAAEIERLRAAAEAPVVASGGSDETKPWSATSIADLAGAFGMGPRNAKAFAAKLISEIPRIAAAPASPAAPVAPWIQLGHGAVTIGQGNHEGIPAILFGKNGTGTVGEESEGDRFMEPGELLCAITFRNGASIGVLEEKLRELRARIWPEAAAPVAQPADELRAALTAMLKRYGDLAGSGDAGHWDWEAEDVVQQARAALAATPAAPLAQQSEPVGEVVLFCEMGREIAWTKGQMPPIGTRLYAGSAPASPVPSDDEIETERRESWKNGYSEGFEAAKALLAAPASTGPCSDDTAKEIDERAEMKLFNEWAWKGVKGREPIGRMHGSDAAREAWMARAALSAAEHEGEHMNEELKPCPFCGGAAHIWQPNMTQYAALCRRCDSEGEAKTTYEQAIAAWNRRALPAPAASEGQSYRPGQLQTTPEFQALAVEWAGIDAERDGRPVAEAAAQADDGLTPAKSLQIMRAMGEHMGEWGEARDDVAEDEMAHEALRYLLAAAPTAQPTPRPAADAGRNAAQPTPPDDERELLREAAKFGQFADLPKAVQNALFRLIELPSAPPADADLDYLLEYIPQAAVRAAARQKIAALRQPGALPDEAEAMFRKGYVAGWSAHGGALPYPGSTDADAFRQIADEAMAEARSLAAKQAGKDA